MLAPASFTQARQYLARVLPWPGEDEAPAYVNVHWSYKRQGHDKPAWSGRATRSIEEAINAVGWALGLPDTRDVYVCMSTQREANEATSQKGFKYYKPIRRQTNAVALKSFFIDLDAKGVDKNSYANMNEAIAGLAAFIKATGLPKPSVVVLSGGGLHVYWTVMRALTPDEWNPIAYALAEATKREGLKCDTQCTVDSARVLRIPDTFNHKADTPRPVRLAGPRQDFDYTVERIEKALEPYKTIVPSNRHQLALDPKIFPPRPPLQGKSDLSAGIDNEYPPVHLDDVAKECGFIREAIATGGAGYTNPLWNLTTLIATFTDDPRVDAHRMGDKHPGYTRESTDEQFERKVRERDEKGLGWPSCAAISGSGCKACATCPHLKEGKSPLRFALKPVTLEVTSVATTSAWNAGDPLDFITTTADDAVQRINTEYFFRRDTSEICRQDAVGGEIQVLTPQQLKTALAGRWAEAVDPKTDKTKVRDAATVWLESRKRREVFGVQYCPNNVGLRQGHLNLWLGWGIQPGPGYCSIVLDHIRQVIASGNVQKAEFIINWCADIVQNPARKPGVALVLRGREGTGKSVLGAILRRLLGARNVVVNADKDRLLGKFNSALASKILIQAEETFFAGDSRTADALKHLITGQTLAVEVKFGRSFEIDSAHRLLITSNHVQVIQASSEARRFVVCDVSDARRGDPYYFDRLYAVADGRDDVTARAFMYHLLSRDLSKFQPWAAQQQFLGDKALIQQKALTLSPPLAWLWEVLEETDREVPLGGIGHGWHNGKPVRGEWPTKFARSDVLRTFRDWVAVAKPHGASAYTGSQQRFWSEITRVIPRRLTAVKGADGNRCVTISLVNARACFRRHMQGEVND
jgi:hypothetical protein